MSVAFASPAISLGEARLSDTAFTAKVKGLGTIELETRDKRHQDVEIRDGRSSRRLTVERREGTLRIRRLLGRKLIHASLELFGDPAGAREFRLSFSARNQRGKLGGGFFRLEGRIGPNGRAAFIRTRRAPLVFAAARGINCPEHPLRVDARDPLNVSESQLRELELRVEADPSYLGRTGTPEIEIASAVSAMSAIYESQVGVRISLSEVRIHRESDPYATPEGEPIFSILEAFRTRHLDGGASVQRDAHLLFTGKPTVDDSAAGVAYLGGVCSEFSLAVTKHNHPAIDYLVAAHEILHLLGANHDESAPNLMAPGLEESPSGAVITAQSRAEVTTTLALSGSCLGNINGDPLPLPPQPSFPFISGGELALSLKTDGSFKASIKLSGELDPNGTMSVQLSPDAEFRESISTSEFPTAVSSLSFSGKANLGIKRCQKTKRGKLCKKIKKVIPLAPGSPRHLYARLSVSQLRGTRGYDFSIQLTLPASKLDRSAAMARLLEAIEKGLRAKLASHVG